MYTTAWCTSCRKGARSHPAWAVKKKKRMLVKNFGYIYIYIHIYIYIYSYTYVCITKHIYISTCSHPHTYMSAPVRCRPVTAHVSCISVHITLYLTSTNLDSTILGATTAAIVVPVARSEFVWSCVFVRVCLWPCFYRVCVTCWSFLPVGCRPVAARLCMCWARPQTPRNEQINRSASLVFVWGFGVLFLSCACVSVSGCFYLSVCVCVWTFDLFTCEM